jgi:hypothetical protein
MDRGLSPELSAQYGGLAQLPLVGQAIVMAYNVTALNSTDPNIVPPPRPFSFSPCSSQSSTSLCACDGCVVCHRWWTGRR